MSNLRVAGLGRHYAIMIVGAALAVAALAWAAYGFYRMGVDRGMSLATTSSGSGPTAAAKPGDVDPTTGRKILYWHDPMVPAQRFDAPGKSPFMNMALVPVYEGAAGAESSITVNPRIQQNLGIRTAEVLHSTMTPRLEAVGNIAFNERDQVIVQARATGYVEKLLVRAALDHVAAGQPLAEIYVPDWIAAQEEFLSLLRMRGENLAGLIDAARQRMRQVGMTDEQIGAVEKLGAAQPRITLRAPIAGVVADLAVREGMTVMPGETLFGINGLSTVWANAEVPESQAGFLRPGARVAAHSPAIPNTVFDGTVQAILPSVDTSTRTIKARVELANPSGELVPGMFVSISIAGPANEALMVPTEAVIETGRRTVVMVVEANGTFAPVDVEIGIEANGQTEIKRGLTAGQRVVVSGQFLIDSEASLRATSTRMQSAGPPQNSAVEHSGEGKIEALDDRSVTLSHGPIPSIQWNAMTMQFGLPAGTATGTLNVGQRARFTFVMGADGKPRITRIEPLTEGPQ
ncbi:MAG: efflux RND transporter periplasmic adaptor subunit [Gammaproteobacteria bacterium]